MEKLDDCYGMETGPSDVHSTLGSPKSVNMSMGVVHNRRRQLGGVKNPEKLPTSFMDGPYCNNNKQVTLLAANK